MSALGGAESLRLTTLKLVQDHEFAAGAPWVTSIPASQHLIAKYATLYAAELLVAYEIKKPHSWLPGDKIIRKLWWAYPAARERSTSRTRWATSELNLRRAALHLSANCNDFVNLS